MIIQIQYTYFTAFLVHINFLRLQQHLHDIKMALGCCSYQSRHLPIILDNAYIIYVAAEIMQQNDQCIYIYIYREYGEQKQKNQYITITSLFASYSRSSAVACGRRREIVFLFPSSAASQILCFRLCIYDNILDEEFHVHYSILNII